MLGFNDTSPLVGHFVSSPREREERDRKDSRDVREEQGGKRNRNESEKNRKKHKYSPFTLTCYKDSPNCKPASVGRPRDVRYDTFVPPDHPPPPPASQHHHHHPLRCMPTAKALISLHSTFRVIAALLQNHLIL